MTVYFDNNSGISIELKARLGWDEPNKYPHSVLVQHDCCHDYGIRYFPERTCRAVVKGTSITCSVCKADLHEPFNYCPNCGAKVVE